MLLPRRVLRRLRFVSLFYRLTWAVWSAVTVRLPATAATNFSGFTARCRWCCCSACGLPA